MVSWLAALAVIGPKRPLKLEGGFRAEEASDLRYGSQKWLKKGRLSFGLLVFPLF
jgi:hypothetical protein